MALDTLTQFVEALRQAQLLTAGQWEELTAVQGQFPDVPALARELVKRGWLTPYQANQLVRGRGKELLLGSYHVLEPLGEGGMGIVYKARHPLMKRVVAIKVIRTERFGGADALRRFEREIVVAGKLLHPNVVIAHDADRVGNNILLVMEYVEGLDLGKLLRQRGPLPVGEACEYIRQAALGLQHAHEQGLVHRDIKPSNLLVAAKGQVVKVLDMGLALLGGSVEESVTALTETGMVMGTPDYMAPEQADNAHTVDIRADIYSLGCTLYALLTGRAPFAGGSLAQKIAAHLHAEPQPLDGLRQGLPPGLLAVVRRMMAERPDDRYRTPAEVAAALQPFCRPPAEGLSGLSAADPAAAPPVSLSQGGSTIASSPTELGTPTIPVSIVPVAPTATLTAPLAARSRRLWVLAGAGGGALLLVLILWLALGGSSGSGGDPPDKQPVAKNAGLELDPDAPTVEIHKFVGHTRQVNCVVLSRDGKRAYSGSSDRTVRVWDAKTAEELHRFDVGKGIWGISLSPDGKYLLAGEAGWFDDDGYQLAAPYDLRLWDLQTRQEVRRFKGHEKEILAVAFLPDGQQFLSSGWEGTWQWDLAGDKGPRRRLPGLDNFINLSVSADGRLALLSHPADHTLRLFDLKEWETLRLFKGPKAGFRAAALSADGRRAMGGCYDKDVLWWDATTGKELRAAAPHPSVVTGLALTADGRWGATGGGTTWDPKTGSARSLGEDPHIRLFDLDSGKEVRRFEGHTGSIMGLAFSADGRYLLSGACDNTLRLWRWAK